MSIRDSWLTKQYIAHRGLHTAEFPENSLGAFQNAVDHNYPIELDVHLLEDGKVVVFHDSSLKRMTGMDGYISALTSDKLKACKLNKTDYSIPLFCEVLELVSGSVPILIEIKNSGKVGPLEKAVLACLKDYNGEYAVQSFNPYSMEYFKLNAPMIPRGQLSCLFKGEKLARFKKFALKRMLLNKRVSCPDFISYAYTDMPNRYLNRYKNLPVLAWTVRSGEAFEQVKQLCDNVIFEGFLPD